MLDVSVGWWCWNCLGKWCDDSHESSKGNGHFEKRCGLEINCKKIGSMMMFGVDDCNVRRCVLAGLG